MTAHSDAHVPTPGPAPASPSAHDHVPAPGHAPGAAPGPAFPRRWTALALLCTAQFMLVLDVTVVNVALPAIDDDLHLGRTALTWVVTAYTLCFGGLMLLGGRLADALGARRVLITGLALFTAASLLCGLAPNAGLLIGGRIAQGVGAALLSPAALALVTTLFHGPERPRALGVWAAIGGTGSAVGVLLGGALTDGPGWSWIFFLNVPVGLALLAALPRILPATAPRRARLDVPGALLVTAATGTLVYGLVRAGDTGWASAATLLPLLAAPVLYGLFAKVEKAAPAPLMDPRMLTRRPVVAGSLLMLVATGLLISFFFLGSALLQHVHHLSALRTGLLFLPVALATAVGAHLGSRLVGTVGPRLLATAGAAVTALALLPLTLLPADAGPWTTLLPALSVAALGLGAVFVTATTTALGLTAPHEAGLASGIVNTSHELGGTLGVAAVSTLAAPALQGPDPATFTTAFTLLATTAAVTTLLAPALVPKGTPHLTAGPHAH
ncbi:MFS transporter [Streptomyces sp. NPDC126499]|uniref:MFS transporter n=1 Tax=Streptomyces sp. NPDC126499 TaxID=3155314 RepID=UPI003321C871